jgi:putative acetyltransferase
MYLIEKSFITGNESNMKITQYLSDNAKEVTDIFYKSVHSIDPAIYSKQQQQAWAPLPINYEKWKARFEDKEPYLLIMNSCITGFIELEPDGHIGCLYVLPKYQKQGIAAALLKYVINAAEDANMKCLHVEASIIARPFFNKFGFELVSENKVIRNNLILTNYSMSMKIVYK